MKVTIKDIARLSGFSTATVSKVINGKDENITKETREKVLRIAQEHNYVPNTIARSMVTKKTRTIGLIIPDIVNPFFPEVARGAEDMASKMGYNLILCNTDNDQKKEEKYINMLEEKMVDGIIFTASSKGFTDLERLKRLKVPVIFVDRDVECDDILGKITVNNELGAYEGVSHMIHKGMKKIIHITGSLSNKPADDRLQGYKKALMKNKIEYSPDNVFEGDFTVGWGYKAVEKAFERGINFDGVFCGNDLIAIGVIKALKKKGISVPQQCGVVGFDDIEISAMMVPSLTTVSQPKYDMGNITAKVLIDIIEGKEKSKNIDIVLESYLIERETT
ncbi:MAG: LacI family transcriptional regulator [Firmicutes bacterium]|jgi:LacI family transcriptional regulator|nr:LacI family transcriptional regulator [Bacillota bacterium]